MVLLRRITREHLREQLYFLRLFRYSAARAKISGTLNIEEPNNRIYKFDGNFDLTEYSKNRLGAPDSS